MAQKQLANYLRSHRKKSGFTQRELAYILGYDCEGQVSRHERTNTVPPLLAALGYQVVFRVPVSELFPGVYQGVEQSIEARLADIELAFQQKSGKGRDANPTACKLEWLWQRRTSIGL